MILLTVFGICIFYNIYKMYCNDLGIEINCHLGIHNYYYGSYSHPVWGRYERHCLDCNHKEYSCYKKYTKKRNWIKF